MTNNAFTPELNVGSSDYFAGLVAILSAEQVSNYYFSFIRKSFKNLSFVFTGPMVTFWESATA